MVTPTQNDANALLAEPWAFSVASLRGVHSEVNQDSYACRSPDFFMVADGVGGGALGEVASAMLVRQLAQLQAPDAAQVQRALRDADLAISQRMDQEGQGPGAAVAAAVWLTDVATSTWLSMVVGDCKVMVAARESASWRIRWSSPVQSYAQCDLPPPAGVDALAPANMVGCGMALPAWVQPITLAPGEILVLCSDGFYNAFTEDQWPDLCRQITPIRDAHSEFLSDAHRQYPFDPQVAQHWALQAQRNGALDDVTVLVVQNNNTPLVRSAAWRMGLWAGVCLSFLALGLAWATVWAEMLIWMDGLRA